MIMRLAGNHLGRHILQSPTERVPNHVSVLFDTPAKITNLQYIFIAHQQVLRFQITMNETIHM